MLRVEHNFVTLYFRESSNNDLIRTGGIYFSINYQLDGSFNVEDNKGVEFEVATHCFKLQF